MSDERYSYITDKIVDHKTAQQRIATWHLKNDRVIFTNGCFDILHKGHVSYLAHAASLGNRLVVALNTDASVKRQGKGDNRPVNNQDARGLVMSAIGFVDLVVFFDDDTPLDVIKDLKPDVLVKGADYNPNETNPAEKTYIVGSDIVRSYGGTVDVIPFVEGFSTTRIIEDLRK